MVAELTKLGAYLARSGYAGLLELSLTTLRALHRPHLLRVPYETDASGAQGLRASLLVA